MATRVSLSRRIQSTLLSFSGQLGGQRREDERKHQGGDPDGLGDGDDLLDEELEEGDDHHQPCGRGR